MNTTTIRQSWLLPLLMFGLAGLLLLPQAVLQPDPGYALEGHDFTGNFYPLYGYTAELVRDGELPLWNPRQYIGMPVAGNPQAAIFYPATWAIWLLNIGGISVPRAMGLMVVLHIGLAGWGMAVLTRQYGVTLPAAVAAGVIYAMSGWAGSRIYAGHYTIITVFAWIPWFLAAYRQVLHVGGWRWLLLAAGIFGVMALAGHPQMVLYGVMGAGVLLLVQVFTAEDNAAWGVFAAGARRLFLIGLIGGALGAALILPTAELTSASARNNTDIRFVNDFALQPAQYTTLALPFLYGNPKLEPSRYWGQVTFEEMTAYAGLLPLLALLLVFRMRDGRAIFWVALIVIGLVLSVGVDGVLFALLVRWIPGFSLFRAPGRFLYFVAFGLAGLTALLLTHLQQATPDRRRVTVAPALRALPVIAGVLFIGSVYFSGWFASASHVEPMPHRARQVASVLGYAGVVAGLLWGTLRLISDRDHRLFRVGMVCALVLVTFDAWRVVVPILTTRDVSIRPLWNGAQVDVPTGADARVIAYADPNNYQRDPANSASLTGHLHIEGYDPLEITSYTDFRRASGLDPDALFFDLLGVRYLLTWEPRDDSGYELIGIQPGGIYYENTDPFPRAWVPNTVRVESNDAAARQLVVNEEIDPRQVVILREDIDCEMGSEPGTAEITEYRPNDITIQVRSNGGFLVLSDQFFPGWQARINGEPTEVVRAYTTFRGICVPPGMHTVTFAYRPMTVWAGAGVSALAWLVWGVGLAVVGRRQGEGE